jgi:hypothetical protein
MQAPSCASNCNWYMWERVCNKLRFRPVIARTETIVFIQNYFDRNTLPSTGGGWKVLSHTLEEVAVENEQRDIEDGVSELLMHESWSGTPTHPSTPLFPTSALHAKICCGLLLYTTNMMLCVCGSLMKLPASAGLSWVHVGHPQRDAIPFPRHQCVNHPVTHQL